MWEYSWSTVTFWFALRDFSRRKNSKIRHQHRRVRGIDQIDRRTLDMYVNSDTAWPRAMKRNSHGKENREELVSVRGVETVKEEFFVVFHKFFARHIFRLSFSCCSVGWLPDWFFSIHSQQLPTFRLIFTAIVAIAIITDRGRIQLIAACTWQDADRVDGGREALDLQ